MLGFHSVVWERHLAAMSSSQKAAPTRPDLLIDKGALGTMMRGSHFSNSEDTDCQYAGSLD
jgi:hypothetical protein